MGMKHHALQLYDYHVWANGKVFQHLNTLPGDIYRQEVQSVFPSIQAVLAHIYLVDRIWLWAMFGKRYEDVVDALPQIREQANQAELEEMEQLYSDLENQYRAFFEDPTTDLDAVNAYPHPQYGTLKARHSDIVQHIVNHGTYHRGNLTAILRQMGHAGVPTDYAFYLYSLDVN